MLRHLTLLFVIVSASITVSNPIRGEIFTESGLVDIPTGRVLEHGIFAVEVYVAVEHSSEDPPRTGMPSADEIDPFGNAFAARLNFGLFDRVEIGLKHLWTKRYLNLPSSNRTANLKIQLLKEQETGVIPSVTIGVENFGDKLFSYGQWEEYATTPSVFLAISKIFNLPRIHQFSGHIGIGTQRFAFEESPIGVFVGLSKEFYPTFARGDITTSLEFDGVGVNAGMRYITSSGLQVALGAETLNDPDELRYLVSVSWTNAQILEQIRETQRLITRATELAVAAKRAVSKKKAVEETTETPSSQ